MDHAEETIINFECQPLDSADQEQFRISTRRQSFQFDRSPIGVYYTQINSRELIKKLESAGWVLRGVKGSHHIFTHPKQPGHITVPHPKHDLGTGLVRKLLQQAGLDKEKLP